VVSQNQEYCKEPSLDTVINFLFSSNTQIYQLITKKISKKMTKPTDNQKGSNILGLFDLSDPIKDIYLSVLKAGTTTVNDFIKTTNMQIDKTEVKIYLDILVRQEYLEKYKDDSVIKYKVKGLKRKARVVPKNIWEMLEKE
jgi:hypothetical protein